MGVSVCLSHFLLTTSSSFVVTDDRSGILYRRPSARAGDSWLLPFLWASDQQAAGCFTSQFPVIFERKSQVPPLINFTLVAPRMRAVLAKKTKCSVALLWSEGPLLTIGPIYILLYQSLPSIQTKSRQTCLVINTTGCFTLCFYSAEIRVLGQMGLLHLFFCTGSKPGC